MDFLLNLDIGLLFFINRTLANPIFDKIFTLLTVQEHWYIVYTILIYFLLFKFQWRGRIFLLTLMLAITLADQLSSHVIKELVERIRPCHTFSDIRLLVPCGAGKSFPSSHAVNNFAAAIILGSFFKNYKIHFILLASLIAFSRVYVGVHYPSDVLAGAILGTLIGVLFIYFHKKLIYKLFKNKENEI